MWVSSQALEATPQPLPSAVGWQPWELWLFFAGLVLGLAVLIPAYRSCLPMPVDGAKPDEHLTLVEWEKDRVMGAGKGMATVAAGFLVAVVTSALKSELGSVPVWMALGCVAGSIGMLLIAAELSRQSADFARSSLIETLKW